MSWPPIKISLLSPPRPRKIKMRGEWLRGASGNTFQTLDTAVSRF
jgi:hypothetical protein